MQDLHDTQAQLEAEQLELGQARYFDMLKTKGAAEMGPGRRLIAAHVDKMVAAINAFTTTKRGRRAAYTVALEQVEPVAAAMLALRTTLQQVIQGKGATAIAANIGQMLVEHLNWKNLRDAEEIGKGAKFMEEKVLKHKGHEKHRRAVASHYVDVHLPPGSKVEWTKETMVQVGMALLEMIESETGLIRLPVVFNHGRKQKQVELTEATAQWLADQNDRFSLLDPLYMPMVVPPKPWSSPTNGGYLTRPTFLMKQQNMDWQPVLREAEMSEMYAAVNRLQGTAFKVNPGILTIAREVMDQNAAIAGIPNQEHEPANAKPADIKTNKEALKEWKAAERDRHERTAAKRNVILASMRIIRMAGKFSSYEAIYFPHFLDFRGRAYPMPVDFHPQGSDLAKGLLTFAEGKPLGEYGMYWLSVHIANLFGVDKVSFDDRVMWVRENADKILESAFNPLECEFWLEADKPWQALAACLEYTGAVISDDPAQYVSHLPIAMDGSCNGLQNLSAMLRDEVGGKATNLTPSAKPQDIYTQVLDKTLEKLHAVFVNEDDVESAGLAANLLDLGISRKVVKRPVMTRPYGSKAYGTRDQLKKELIKLGMYERLPEEGRFDHVMLLAKLVDESISEIVVASKLVMDWLQDCARLAASMNKPLKWVTPIGLPVLQDYRQMMGQDSRIYVGGVRKKFTLLERTDDANKRKQANSISPNMIHSFDASHMMLTINRAAEEFGIEDFCMVHDSFATHACSVGELAGCIRATFIEMYSEDHLQNLLVQFINQLPEVTEWPEPPAMGNLDIELVAESDYFFA